MSYMAAKKPLPSSPKGTSGKGSKKPKPKSVASLKKQADKYFSLAVRLRDSDRYGVAQCITCDSRLPYKAGHAGHFMSRRYGATRYEPENVNFQCVKCNTFNAGEQYKYSLAVDLKYGNGTAKKLAQLAHSDFKMSRTLLEEVITNSKAEIKWYGENH